ncbi:D-isomer specific 2-hydroxyacid dehydrogenase family protein [Pseudooceanicola batsensis HTCC2597]|uniref:D-isomer specific 2-hydroxyacid dehydrogenase family protein n=1 Tax=Pseudooceanicola batsensis (strain ATCC BAA-863 / DSM 15984 / KCTC 12145 / HTCC2597) TaxID=252305 RepID=A3TTU2_PSEBH|nr:glyoxylate/hydroxypyruvate reductase A [Pseudooceanicola batsensis]EAQ05069.1 D-isomer specific 2-hydroxyacid dehydrogenase family protein [Pseudooceanicola batsensis HTCC2597]
MTINVLFAATEARWQDYRAPLTEAFREHDLDVSLKTDLPPEEVDYIVYAPNSAVQDFTPFTRCKAVLNLWAGVEGIVGNETLTMPLARMVDPALTRGMVEWVAGHVLRHHLEIDYFLARQQGEWCPRVPPLASERSVTILGLGELGTACGQTLADLGFPVTGWSRSPKRIEGIATVHGDDGLDAALAQAQILVLLLPKTPETENVLDADALARLPRGAAVINPGRGHLIDDEALLAALDAGTVGHATLDVFREEPLPADHPFWSHERVTVTPHIASETRPASASRVIAENIRRGEEGEPLLHLVDRDRGY